MRMGSIRQFRMSALFVAISLLAAVGVMLAVPPATTAAQSEQTGDPENGAELFAQNCATCHGEQGEGRIGARLNDVFVSMNPEADLFQTISQGREGTFMPPWLEQYGGPLTDQQIRDIIAYIESWGTTYEPPVPAPPRPAQEIPPVEEVQGDPNNGYTIFQQNCVACHGEQGEGRIGRNLHQAFASVEPGAYAIDIISNGIDGTLMPAWSQDNGGPLTDQQIQDVAAYVFSFQEPAQARPPGDQPVPVPSSLPLLAVVALSVLVILALGITASRGQRGGLASLEAALGEFLQWGWRIAVV